jgi:hypothetical protein
MAVAANAAGPNPDPGIAAVGPDQFALDVQAGKRVLPTPIESPPLPG